MRLDRAGSTIAPVPPTIVPNHPGCPPETPWAVVDSESGEVAGCHPDRAAAETAMGAVEPSAAASTQGVAKFEDVGYQGLVLTPDNLEEPPERVVYVLAEEEVLTSDGRGLRAGSIDWREPPLSLTREHDPSWLVGRIDKIERTASIDGLLADSWDSWEFGSGRYIVGLVTFDLQGEAGADTARQVHQKFLNGASVELGDLLSEVACAETSEMGECLREESWVVQGTIGAVTVCSFQAIESAKVLQPGVAPDVDAVPMVMPHDDGPAASIEDAAPELPDAVVASLPSPPDEWFEDPGFTGPMPLIVEPDGRVYGHLALWGTCHVGYPGRCKTPPPPTPSNYGYFLTGQRRTSKGLRRVGLLTMDTGHENDLRATAADSVAHYDNTGTQAATVNAGNDVYGIWIAGALLSDVTEGQVERIVASGRMSGDWRPIGGRAELVRALIVNTPGFPIPDTRALVAGGGEVLAMVAAGPGPESPCLTDGGHTNANPLAGRFSLVEARADDHERRLHALELAVAHSGVLDTAADALAASLRPPE